MSRNNLTDNAIKNLKPAEKEYLVSDGDGLTLRVRPNGSKDWLFRYRTEGKIKKVGLGSYPDKTLASARSTADELRRFRADGKDPSREVIAGVASRKREALSLHEPESNMTMDDLYAAWFNDHGVTLERHWQDCRHSQWQCHISPAIGPKLIDQADRQSVLLRYGELVREGKEHTARKALSLLRQVVAWGVEREYVSDEHSLTRLTVPKTKRAIREDQRPENFSIEEYLQKNGGEIAEDDLEGGLSGRSLQFPELVTLLHGILPISSQAITGVHLMRFMLATGVRSSEATRLRWKWIDMNQRLAVFPAGSMKKSRMHHVHLSDFALRQLEAMQAIQKGDFVFPAPRKENAPILRTNVGCDISTRQFYREPDESDNAYAARLAKRMASRRARKEFDLYNLPGGKWTLYDLRRTVATRLEELGVEREMVAFVLAHARPDAKTTGRYARFSHWSDRCRVLDLLGEALAACECGKLPDLS